MSRLGRRPRLSGRAGGPIVLAAVVGGVLLMGSPSEQRQRQLDRRRVDDLQKIAAAIDVYRTRQQRLPASLDDLGQAPGRGPSFRDPATGLAYEYRVRGDSAVRALGASLGRKRTRNFSRRCAASSIR